MIRQIFEAVQLRLADKLGSKLAEIDYFLQQYTQQGDNYQIVSPAAYIEFAELNTSDMMNHVQEVEMKLRIHTVTEVLYTDGRRVTDEAVGHMQLVTDIYRALYGHDFLLSELPGMSELAGTDQDFVILNRLSRSSVVTDSKLGNLMVTTQIFDGTFQDWSAKDEYNTIIASLKVVRATSE